MNLKSILLFLFCFSMVGCASVGRSFDPAKPVHPEERALGRIYTQEGRPVRLDDLFREFQDSPATSDVASRGKKWFYAGTATSFAGGFLVGANLFSTSDSKTAGLAGGAVLIGLGYLFLHNADDDVAEAVEIHNHNVGTAKGAWRDWSLVPSVITDSGGTSVPGACLSVSF